MYRIFENRIYEGVRVIKSQESREASFGFLSSFSLKVIACILMAIDHIGYRLLPGVVELRIIGRLAFPIFAFFIAEGCRYTRRPWKRFLTVFLFGVAYLLFYLVYDGILYASIFLTFSVSILVIMLLKWCKTYIFNDFKLYKALLALLFFALTLLLLYPLFEVMRFDYGYAGMLVPVFINLFDFRGTNAPEALKKLDTHSTKLLCLTASLLILAANGSMGNIQYYSLLSLIPLLFYNGKPGISRFKYGFYIFYPVHLIIIEAIRLFF